MENPKLVQSPWQKYFAMTLPKIALEMTNCAFFCFKRGLECAVGGCKNFAPAPLFKVFATTIAKVHIRKNYGKVIPFWICGEKGETLSLLGKKQSFYPMRRIIQRAKASPKTIIPLEMIFDDWIMDVLEHFTSFP